MAEPRWKRTDRGWLLERRGLRLEVTDDRCEDGGGTRHTCFHVRGRMGLLELGHWGGRHFGDNSERAFRQAGLLYRALRPAQLSLMEDEAEQVFARDKLASAIAEREREEFRARADEQKREKLAREASRDPRIKQMRVALIPPEGGRSRLAGEVVSIDESTVGVHVFPKRTGCVALASRYTGTIFTPERYEGWWIAPGSMERIREHWGVSA